MGSQHWRCPSGSARQRCSLELRSRASPSSCSQIIPLAFSHNYRSQSALHILSSALGYWSTILSTLCFQLTCICRPRGREKVILAPAQSQNPDGRLVRGWWKAKRASYILAGQAKHAHDDDCPMINYKLPSTANAFCVCNINLSLLLRHAANHPQSIEPTSTGPSTNNSSRRHRRAAILPALSSLLLGSICSLSLIFDLLLTFVWKSLTSSKLSLPLPFPII